MWTPISNRGRRAIALLVLGLAVALVPDPAAASGRIGVSFGVHSHYPYHHWGYPYWHRPYSWYRPYYWGYWGAVEPWGDAYPVGVGTPRAGAVDLSVRPKGTEVYVDGQYAGLSGGFDGFPAYLWLEEGTHEIALHHPGYSTETRDVRVLPGGVLRLEARLVPGESVRPQPPAAEVSAVPPRAEPTEPRIPPSGSIDARAEPGQVRLAIVPGDAGVYLDGRFLGSAAELGRLHAGLMVDAGQHVLEVVRPGYEARRLEFLVEAGEEVELAVELEEG